MTAPPHQGRALKAARVLAGLEQAELAEAAGMHRNAIAASEVLAVPRFNRPSMARIKTVLRAHGVELIADAAGAICGTRTCATVPRVRSFESRMTRDRHKSTAVNTARPVEPENPPENPPAPNIQHEPASIEQLRAMFAAM